MRGQRERESVDYCHRTGGGALDLGIWFEFIPYYKTKSELSFERVQGALTHLIHLAIQQSQGLKCCLTDIIVTLWVNPNPRPKCLLWLSEHFRP